MALVRRLFAILRRPPIEPDRFARALEVWHGAAPGGPTCPGCHQDARKIIAIYEAIG